MAIIIALAHGVGLLALVLLAYRFLLRRFGARRHAFPCLSGLLFGVAAVISMLDAYPVDAGVLIDLRNTMVGLFGGWPAALVSAGLAGAVRLVTDDWGAPQDYVIVERDVTARKMMEAELQDARHAAEAASRTKTEFLASLSHELRTPMNAVIGFADLIARESEGPVGNAHYRDFAVNIRDSGQHLLELINEILDHVRAEAGQLVLDDEVVDLDAAAVFAIRLLTPRAARAASARSC